MRNVGKVERVLSKLAARESPVVAQWCSVWCLGWCRILTVSSSRQYSRYSGAGILASDWSDDPILPSHWSIAASPRFTNFCPAETFKVESLRYISFDLLFGSIYSSVHKRSKIKIRNICKLWNSPHCNCMIACDFLSFYFLNLNFSFGLKFWVLFPKCLYLVTNDNNKCLFAV